MKLGVQIEIRNRPQNKIWDGLYDGNYPANSAKQIWQSVETRRQIAFITSIMDQLHDYIQQRIS